MLAKPVHALPDGERWLFEPKWDGFRALVFRDADELFIQSRDEKPLGRYYPELIEPLRMQLPQRCVLDGEIVIVRSGGLDFEALQLRLHPAESRVRLLAKEMPASVVFFGILCARTVLPLIRLRRSRSRRSNGILGSTTTRPGSSSPKAMNFCG